MFSSKNQHSRLFVAASCLAGFQLWPSTILYRLSTYLFLIVNIILNCAFILVTFDHWRRISNKPSSCTEIAGCFRDTFRLLFAMKTLWLFIMKRKELNDLLGSSGAHWTAHLRVIACGLPLMALRIKLATENALANRPLACLGNLCYAILPYYKTFVLMLYLESASVLGNKHQALLASVTDPFMNLEELSKMKWSIRDVIHSINQLFATVLALSYVQLFIGAIYTLGYLATSDQRLDSWSVLLSYLCMVVQLYMIAQQSSQLADTLIDVQRRILQKRSETPFGVRALGSSSCSPPAILWNVLSFDEKWDCLRVSFFYHRRATLVSFLATCMTFTAIMLQFDFHVIYVINDLSKQ